VIRAKYTVDPLKLRQLTELLAQTIAARVGIFLSTEESQYELIRRLQDQGILPREVYQLFSEVRRAGNAASHEMTGDHSRALTTMKITWQLGAWFHRPSEHLVKEDAAVYPAQEHEVW
jgi:type I restriction enzyme, R subunit